MIHQNSHDEVGRINLRALKNCLLHYFSVNLVKMKSRMCFPSQGFTLTITFGTDANILEIIQY